MMLSPNFRSITALLFSSDGGCSVAILKRMELHMRIGPQSLEVLAPSRWSLSM